MVIRVFDERWTTRRSEAIRLSMMPISMFHTIAQKKVRNMRLRSTQALILRRCEYDKRRQNN
jgi:hypothetical protein